MIIGGIFAYFYPGPFISLKSQMVIIPLFVDMAIRYKWKKQVQKILPVFPALSATFIIFICALVISLNNEYLSQLTLAIILVTITLNIYGILAGYSVGHLYHHRLISRRYYMGQSCAAIFSGKLSTGVSQRGKTGASMLSEPMIL